MVKLLHEAGADLNRQCAYGWTPLTKASRYGHYDVAEWLVNQGCDVTLKTNQGATALYMACCYKYERLVALLLPHSSSVLNDPTDDGFTPLIVACEDTYEKIPLVEKHPEQKTTKDEYLERQTRIVAMLVAAGADVNAHTDGGVTALHHAIQNSADLPVVKQLLAGGASLDHRTNLGYLPLHAAAQKSDTPTFECLVQGGATIEPMKSSHETTGRTYHMYADYLKGESPLQESRPYYTKAIQEYEMAIEKNQAMASSLGKKILGLKTKKFAADVAMILLAAAASSYSTTTTYYYVPGRLDLSSLQQRKKHCEEVVARCEQWLEECRGKRL